MTRVAALIVIVIAGCDAGAGGPLPDGGEPPPPPDAVAVRPALEIRALGVQGFALRVGDDVVLTAPMFTRQPMLDIVVRATLTPDEPAIAAGLADIDLGRVRAVVSGHAHYDHLLDVPPILGLAPAARAYTNRTGRHLLAAFAPDRPGCTNAQPTPVLDRARVIAMDDASDSHVDYTHCPAQRPPGAPLRGTWLAVPDSHVRILAMCSMHPPQIGPVHFGEGEVTADGCAPPRAAADWLEGQTLAFLIDFLDDRGEVAHRVFYQDAPTDAPSGEVPAAVLTEAPVDVALLCVGSNDSVDDQPTAAIANLAPRFVVSGHWEDFFQPREQPLQPIFGLDLDTYIERAEAALAPPTDPPWRLDGAPQPGRHVLARPGLQVVAPPRT